ncbi:hypothetical protein BC629DRAFT_1437889 [Irpex lacteus]|nr:hypothetical protein BC629DRAFT_1437889 [Irpex lacteus]
MVLGQNESSSTTPRFNRPHGSQMESNQLSLGNGYFPLAQLLIGQAIESESHAHPLATAAHEILGCLTFLSRMSTTMGVIGIFICHAARVIEARTHYRCTIEEVNEVGGEVKSVPRGGGIYQIRHFAASFHRCRRYRRSYRNTNTLGSRSKGDLPATPRADRSQETPASS